MQDKKTPNFVRVCDISDCEIQIIASCSCLAFLDLLNLLYFTNFQCKQSLTATKSITLVTMPEGCVQQALYHQSTKNNMQQWAWPTQ